MPEITLRIRTADDGSVLAVEVVEPRRSAPWPSHRTPTTVTNAVAEWAPTPRFVDLIMAVLNGAEGASASLPVTGDTHTVNLYPRGRRNARLAAIAVNKTKAPTVWVALPESSVGDRRWPDAAASYNNGTEFAYLKLALVDESAVAQALAMIEAKADEALYHMAGS